VEPRLEVSVAHEVVESNPHREGQCHTIVIPFRRASDKKPSGDASLLSSMSRAVIPVPKIRCYPPLEHLLDFDLIDDCRSERSATSVPTVWRNKAALDLVVQTEIDEGAPAEKDNFFEMTMSDSSRLDGSSHNSVGHIEIYLVDRLRNWRLTGIEITGGGVTLNCGEASACCILEVSMLAGNPFLLSHELGHVLGLDHPDGPMNRAGSAKLDRRQPPDVNIIHFTTAGYSGMCRGGSVEVLRSIYYNEADPPQMTLRSRLAQHIGQMQCQWR
jgi:hypothetical protein